MKTTQDAQETKSSPSDLWPEGSLFWASPASSPRSDVVMDVHEAAGRVRRGLRIFATKFGAVPVSARERAG